MRNEIQQLEEAIAGVMSPIVSIRTKADEEALDERATQVGPTVSMAHIMKLADAMVDSPRAAQVISGMLRKAGSEDPEGVTKFQSIMRGFLQNSLPVLLQDGGVKVQAAAAGKGRRGLKAVGSGMSVGEAMEMWDEPLSESESSEQDDGQALREELAGLL